MKLFVYDWTFVTKHELYRALSNINIEVSYFKSTVNPRIAANYDKFMEELNKAFSSGNYDAIFTVNYFQPIADYANEKGCIYICWTYDSPAVLGRTTSELSLETNRLFIFDSFEYNEIKNRGINNVHYMPLASDARYYSRMQLRPIDALKYSSDISFVGQLYQADMDKVLPLFDEFSAGYIASLVNTQMNVYGRDLIIELLNDELIDYICNDDVKKVLIEQIAKTIASKETDEVNATGLSLFLKKAVTNKERTIMLQLMAKYFKVSHYSYDKVMLDGVREMGVVDYATEMPKVFKCSKVNLNMTFRNIRNAIPQRVYDIMACRALVLTNYQEDIFKHFEPDRHLVVYSSIEEAVDKAKYYISHEKEAEQIRVNAYKIIKDEYSYESQLSKIFKLSGVTI